MDKKKGTTITIIVGIITLLCCTTPMCLGGIGIFTGTGTWTTTIGLDTQTGDIPIAWGALPCCLSILVLVVPLLSWIFLVRGKEDDESTLASV